jgi:3-phenylpropionate/cinnamic acid dioxygenase small subunit
MTNYAMRLDTTHIRTWYHQLRQSCQLMMQQKHHQPRQSRQLMMQQKHHQRH